MVFLPYTPMRADYDELEKTSVGREPLIRQILKDIDEQSAKKSHQHWILVGPRGIGKSHVMELIYRRIERDPGRLIKWLPVRFPEEAHGIISLRDFFLRLFEYALDEHEREHSDPGNLEACLTMLRNEHNQSYAVERARAFLTDEHRRTGRKYLLFIENLHRIIGSRLTADKKDEHFLRSLLMEDDSILLIGTSLTIFKKIAFSRSALYGLFRTEVLEELNFDDAMSFLEKRCDYYGDTGLKQKISGRKNRERVKGLYMLAGGSPRVLLMLYRIASGIHGVVTIEREFYALLEDMTAYFESRIEQLTVQQEKILIAYAEGPYTLTPTEVSKITLIPQRTVTTQILRLADNGFLKKEKLRSGKSAPYRLAEGLFRYWHQWRSMPGKKRISLLVEFIALWYTRQEIEEVLQGEKSIPDRNERGKDAGFYEKAIENYEKEAGLMPNDYKAFYNWGTALFELARIVKEERLYGESADKYAMCWEIYNRKRLEPDHISINAALNACQLFMKLGNQKRALCIFSEVLQSFPGEEQIEPFKPLFIDVLVGILEEGKLKEAEDLLTMVRQHQFAGSFDFLTPFEYLIQYFITGDDLVLKAQPPELQSVLGEMIRKIHSSKTNA